MSEQTHAISELTSKISNQEILLTQQGLQMSTLKAKIPNQNSEAKILKRNQTSTDNQESRRLWDSIQLEMNSLNVRTWKLETKQAELETKSDFTLKKLGHIKSELSQEASNMIGKITSELNSTSLRMKVLEDLMSSQANSFLKSQSTLPQKCLKH